MKRIVVITALLLVIAILVLLVSVSYLKSKYLAEIEAQKWQTSYWERRYYDLVQSRDTIWIKEKFSSDTTQRISTSISSERESTLISAPVYLCDSLVIDTTVVRGALSNPLVLRLQTKFYYPNDCRKNFLLLSVERWPQLDSSSPISRSSDLKFAAGPALLNERLALSVGLRKGNYNLILLASRRNYGISIMGEI